MSDVIIFAMGCVVSLCVAGAVSLLLWGAAHEPPGELLGSDGDAKPRESTSTGKLKSPA